MAANHNLGWLGRRPNLTHVDVGDTLPHALAALAYAAKSTPIMGYLQRIALNCSRMSTEIGTDQAILYCTTFEQSMVYSKHYVVAVNDQLEPHKYVGRKESENLRLRDGCARAA